MSLGVRPSTSRAIAALVAMIASCALFLWGRVHYGQSTHALVRASDAYLRAQVERFHFSGTVLMSRGGALWMAKGYGEADMHTHSPNTARTRFNLASVTKQFTATAILLLQQQGQLNVADRLCAYLDDCPEQWAPLTLHQLLSHTSGIHNFAYDDALFATRNHDELVALFRDLPLDFEPGTRFSYSNSGYHLLAEVIERVTGQAYGDALRGLIFTPLQMADTGVVDDREEVSHLATGYSYAQDTDSNTRLVPAVESRGFWAKGSGNIYSTVLDLEKWNRALASHRLLDAKSQERMWTPVHDTYGYGWTIEHTTVGDTVRRSVMHSGGNPGFATCLLRYPEDDVAVIVLSNYDPTRSCLLARELSAIMFGEPARMPTSYAEVTLPIETLQRFTGKYRWDGQTKLNLRIKDSLLQVCIDGLQTRQVMCFALHAASKSKFFLNEFPGEIEFDEEAGSATVMRVTLPNRSLVRAPRVND